GFTRMQVRVARKLPRILTVSESSRVDIATKMSIPLDRVVVVPVGVDHDVFRPHPSIARVPGRILAMASAEVALKGVVPLLHAFAEVRRQRDAELVLVTRPKYRSQLPATVRRLGLEESVRLVSGIEDADLLRLYHEAEVAVVPSLYEGFSLPAV